MYSFGTLKCSFLKSVYDKDTMADFKFSTEEKIFIVMYCGGPKNAEVVRLFNILPFYSSFIQMIVMF